MALSWGSRMKNLLAKYGKVGLAVHMSVSAVSIAGFYTAIKHNVDVENLISQLGIHTRANEQHQHENELKSDSNEEEQKKSKSSAEFLASGGGALALAILCNKALFPVRVPITVALTPPIARFLARRKLIKNGVS